jgi:hypothetical protein
MPGEGTPGPAKVKTLPATGIKSNSGGRHPRLVVVHAGVVFPEVAGCPAKKILDDAGTIIITDAGKQPTITKPDNAARTVNFKSVIGVFPQDIDKPYTRYQVRW